MLAGDWLFDKVPHRNAELPIKKEIGILKYILIIEMIAEIEL